MSKIAKVEINGLWNVEDKDYVWNLSQDVNVLSGCSGSGKSTILEAIYDSFTSSKSHSDIFQKRIITMTDGDLSFLHGCECVDYVNCVDMRLFSLEMIHRVTNDSVKTILDLKLYNVIKKYVDYRAHISSQLFSLIQQNNDGDSNSLVDMVKKSTKDIDETLKSINSFKYITNKAFSESNKQLDGDDISFIQNGRKITPYQLSAGEKMLLSILLTVLVQDNKEGVLVLDSPDLGMQTEWQEKLFEWILELNPNVQIIAATQTPSLIANGWFDNVFEISELEKNV